MLKGKTALVTGSTSGIGLGIAKALAAQGANVVLNGFGDAQGPQAEVTALGVRVGYHGADMSKPAEIESMMAYAQETFGGVDILVNNAGIQHVARVENFPVERWDAIMAINLSSAFHATRLALPAMFLPPDDELRCGRVFRLPLEPLPGAVRRAVVDDDDAEVALRLGRQRRQGALENRPPVVGRKDDRKRSSCSGHGRQRRYRRRASGLPARGTLLGSMR